MDDNKKILIINPGSTSTKVGLYDSGKMTVSESVSHPDEELKKFKTIWEQYDFRKAAVFKVLDAHRVSFSDIAAIACRGGNVKPIPGGIY